MASRRRIYVAIAKVITRGMNYRWVFPKIVTGEPGLHGIGSSNNNYDTKARYRGGSRNTSNSG